MSSPEEKAKHGRRLKRKVKERVRSTVAKELLTNRKYKMQVVLDKRGKEHDLKKMTFRDLVEAIEED